MYEFVNNFAVTFKDITIPDKIFRHKLVKSFISGAPDNF